MVWFGTHCSNVQNNRQLDFRLSVAGVVARAAGTVNAGGAGNPVGATLIFQSGALTAGSNTVLIEWRVSAGTGQIRPVAAVNSEYASLLIMEVV
jgi:hypothetical protein